MHKVRNIIFAQLVASLLLSGCSGYKVLSSGVMVDGDPTYYNEESQIVLDVFGDYTRYNEDTENGFSTTKLDRLDKKLLRKLKVPKHAKALFSGTPDTQPFYNIVALVEQNNIDQNSSRYQGYKQYMEGNHLLYYYNKCELMNKRIYHAIIPRATANIHLLYYQNTDDECVYCDIERLAKMNSYSPERKEISYPSTTFSAPDAAEIVQIEIPQRKKADHLGIVKFYDTSNLMLLGFSVIEGNQNTLTFSLPPGNYNWKYTTLNGRILAEDTLTIQY
ncbi:hypothetical protein [Sphingobacterium sp. JB170]|uniref:hypothetical protein n=1 Tax=Sphingobacterium sp. JB170 TaxID=1434842 RepID=UPI00097F0E6D|nr:hypothetical protein [Sphingobacterium sp. JB170]SJN49799.1 hypothetical protein FM107_19245 [Sphingobacterium sp. JB170]